MLISGDNQLPDAGACPPGTGLASGTLDGLRCVGVTSGFVMEQTRYFQCFFREGATLGCMTGQDTPNADRCHGLIAGA